MPPDAEGVGEARGGKGRKWPSAGTVAGDWAEMRILQWFHGVCPLQVPRTRRCGESRVRDDICPLALAERTLI